MEYDTAGHLSYDVQPVVLEDLRLGEQKDKCIMRESILDAI